MYLRVPDGYEPFPAVLVSQHEPGVNECIQDIVNNLAIVAKAAATHP